MATFHRRLRITRMGYSTRTYPVHHANHLAILKTEAGEILDVVQGKRRTVMDVVMRSARGSWAHDTNTPRALVVEVFKGNPRKPLTSFRRVVYRAIIQEGV